MHCLILNDRCVTEQSGEWPRGKTFSPLVRSGGVQDNGTMTPDREIATLLVSAVEDDSIAETIYRPDQHETAFAVATGGSIEIVSEWHSRQGRHVPVRPGNNLLRHQALLRASEPSEYESANKLVDDIQGYVQRYVRLDVEALALCAAYVLLTWLFDCFNELPYLRFRGDYGTGKSRALLVIGSICYKAFFASGASTVSPIFHTLDQFKGTLVFDEADFRFTDEKSELVKILNNGNTRGFPVLRTQVTPKREFDPRAFSIYGPKIVGMRRSYEDKALESRFLTVEMMPGDVDGVPINLPEIQKDEALALRNKLLMYRFRMRKSVGIDPRLADASLEPRLNQILLPLLAVAATPQLRASVRASARRIQAGALADRSNSTEGQLLAIVSGLLSESDAPLSVAEITAAFIAAHGSDYERPIVNRWIGSWLRRLGITLYKRNGVTVLNPGQESQIAVLCGRYGVAQSEAAASPIRGEEI
jgi:hypothetical protein